MNKKMDRIQEMKEMTLDINKRIYGDDYFIGFRSQLQSLIHLIKMNTQILQVMILKL